MTGSELSPRLQINHKNNTSSKCFSPHLGPTAVVNNTMAVVESASVALVVVEAAAPMDVVVEAEVAVVGRGVVSWCPYESAKNE